MSCEPVSTVLTGYYLPARPVTILDRADSSEDAARSQVNTKKWKKQSSDRTLQRHWTVPSLTSHDTLPGPGSGTGVGTGSGSRAAWGTSLLIPTSSSSGGSGIESAKYFVVYVGKCGLQCAAFVCVLYSSTQSTNN
jgi:hypothetical protein